MTDRINELDGSLLATAALCPFPGSVSASRLQMLGAQIGSALTTKGAEPSLIQTGYEREYGKYTFSKKAPCDLIVIKVFQQYRETQGAGGIRENPKRFVLYEDFTSNEIGIMELERYHCIHKDFGFKFRDNPRVSLYPKSKIAKGTIIADSPNVDQDGNYSPGINLNVAFLSDPSTIEDSMWFSNEACDAFTTVISSKRSGAWGTKCYPVNVYGDEFNYKPFPDIGECVREDGLVFAFRKHSDLLAPVKMTPKALREIDFLHDILVYCEAGARLVDVIVYRDPNQRLATPSGMSVQADKYANAMEEFYTELITEYERIAKDRQNKGGIRITNELKTLLTKALAATTKINGRKVQYLMRGVPMGEYYVELTFEHEFIPGVGSKISDFFGGKGVISKKTPRADMPMDSDGNYADVVMDGDATVRRTNNGRMFQHGFNAYARDLNRELRSTINVDRYNPNPDDVNRKLSNPETVDLLFNRLLSFYDTISSTMKEDVLEVCMSHPNFPREHLFKVMTSDIYLNIQTNNTRDLITTVQTLRANFPLTYGPVTYRTAKGNMVKTVNNVLIGKMYMILLDKIGAYPAAVSSAKTQHFGIPAKVTNLDKYATPNRNQPTRIWGETEVRLASTYCSPYFIAETIDRSNNPTKHRHICRNIILSENPMDIANVVDDTVVADNGGRIAAYARHMISCGGAKFVRKTQ